MLRKTLCFVSQFFPRQIFSVTGFRVSFCFRRPKSLQTFKSKITIDVGNEEKNENKKNMLTLMEVSPGNDSVLPYLKKRKARLLPDKIENRLDHYEPSCTWYPLTYGGETLDGVKSTGKEKNTHQRFPQFRLKRVLLSGQVFTWSCIGEVQWTPPGSTAIVTEETEKNDHSTLSKTKYDWYEEYIGSVGGLAIVARQSVVDKPGLKNNLTWIGIIGRCPASTKVSDQDAIQRVRDFFGLCHSQQWSQLDEKFAVADSHYASLPERWRKGICVLRQDPLQCLIAFICSANNNIPRITTMVQYLARTHGSVIVEYKSHKIYRFPKLRHLNGVTESELRANGFGYRANYIVDTIRRLRSMSLNSEADMNEANEQEEAPEQVKHHSDNHAERKSCDKKAVSIDHDDLEFGEKYLLELRARPREEAIEQLMEFKGVGRKVASCVSLFSLDKHDEIPVDTHVWQIFIRNYRPSWKTKKFTNRMHEEIGEYFRQLFGAYAGWAHSVLFVADLSKFKNELDEEKALEGQEPKSCGMSKKKRTKKQGKY